MVGLTDFFRTVGPILLELCVGDLSVASGKAALLCVFSGLGNSKVLHLRGALVSHRNLSILDRRFSVVGRRLLRQLVKDMGPVATPSTTS